MSSLLSLPLANPSRPAVSYRAPAIGRLSARRTVSRAVQKRPGASRRSPPSTDTTPGATCKAPGARARARQAYNLHRVGPRDQRRLPPALGTTPLGGL